MVALTSARMNHQVKVSSSTSTACRPRPLYQRQYSEGAVKAAQTLMALPKSCPSPVPTLPTSSFETDEGSTATSPTTLSYCQPTQEQQQQPEPPTRFYTGSMSLALPTDEQSLSPLHVFLRRHCVEVFSFQGTTHPRLVDGQVGLRCVHCRNAPGGERAVCFPSTLRNLYHSIETWQRRHAATCPYMLPNIRIQLDVLMSESRSGAGGRRQYWMEAAQQIGLVDTEYGLRFSKDPATVVQLQQQQQVIPRQVPLKKRPLSTPVVYPDDAQWVTDYLYLLLSQMEVCEYTHQDRTGGRSKNKLSTDQFKGLQCKHCRGQAGFGRYFPTTLRALCSANSDRNLTNHLLKCRKVPRHVQDELVRFKKANNSGDGGSGNKIKRGYRKLFFTQVWERLHGKEQVQVGVLPRKQKSPTASRASTPSNSSDEDSVFVV